MHGEPRGSGGRYVPKNQPRLKLSDLIRRRKTTLKQMLLERGVSTYTALENWCTRIGVLPPSEEEFRAAMPEPVNSAQEGVVVLEPPRVVDELSGRDIDPEAPVHQPDVMVLTDYPFITHEPETKPVEALVRPQKKAPKKKDDQPSE